MTTKTLSTYVAAGYTLASQYDTLDITATGGIGGSGLKLDAPAKVVNDGFILASGSANGVSAYAAATIVNGSATYQSVEIHGYSGIFTPDAVATVTNFGTIQGRGTYGDGVFIVQGGQVTNGAAGDTAATIYGLQSGVTAGVAAKITNFGTIEGQVSDGVNLSAGGTVTNGSVTDPRALIKGDDSGVVSAGGALTVVNFRTIQGFGAAGDGVTTVGGGTITNGSAGDTNAKIYGVHDGVASTAVARLTNFGTVTGGQQDGVYLQAGGSITNGSTADSRALIKGAIGGVVGQTGATTLKNFGTIAATTSGFGVTLDGGVVTNGSTLATGALIEGFNGGIAAVTASATVINFGVIDGAGSTLSAPVAISLKAGGTVTNGSAGDTTALIEGEGFGVIVDSGFTKVTNFGSIDAFNALYLSGGASVTNGSATDVTAAIIGYAPLVIRDGVGTVANFGSILSYGDHWAVALESGGALTNGDASDTGALIEGGNVGVLIVGAAETVTNFGTIEAALASSGASGVYVASGSVTNGSATDQAALITGRYGVFGAYRGVTTVTNFGTIHGIGGTAVYLGNSGDLLNVEAGSAFVGAVLGGGGTLDLASGVGTLSALGGGNVTVAGSMATATFTAFNSIEVGAGASFTDTGAASISAIDILIAAGTLTVQGALANAGTIETMGGALTVNGTVSGAGLAKIQGGTLFFASTFNQAVTFTGATGMLELADSQTYTGSVRGFSKTGGTSLDLEDIAFTGAGEATFKGNSKRGVLTVTDGIHTASIKLAGDYTAANFIASSDGHGGTLVHDPARTVAVPSPHRLIAAMAGLGGGGAAELAHAAPEPWRHDTRSLAKPA